MTLLLRPNDNVDGYLIPARSRKGTQIIAALPLTLSVALVGEILELKKCNGTLRPRFSTTTIQTQCGYALATASGNNFSNENVHCADPSSMSVLISRGML